MPSKNPSPTDMLTVTQGRLVSRFSGSPSGLRAALSTAHMMRSPANQDVHLEAVLAGGEPGSGVRFTIEEVDDLAPPQRPLLAWWTHVRSHLDQRGVR